MHYEYNPPFPFIFNAIIPIDHRCTQVRKTTTTTTTDETIGHPIHLCTHIILHLSNCCIVFCDIEIVLIEQCKLIMNVRRKIRNKINVRFSTNEKQASGPRRLWWKKPIVCFIVFYVFLICEVALAL